VGPPLTEPRAIAAGLLEAADGLRLLRERTGRRIVLALEPEPGSSCETSAEVADFFTRHLLPHGAAAREHLGLCFDACHQAVEFEAMGPALALLARAGVPVAKVQLSAALVLRDPARHAALLAPWAEDRWFHQVVARGADGTLARLSDLPEALSPHAPAAVREAEEWRVHYHVPLFAERFDAGGALRSTQPELLELLACPSWRPCRISRSRPTPSRCCRPSGARRWACPRCWTACSASCSSRSTPWEAEAAALAVSWRPRNPARRRSRHP
jgi:hypothetical protein